MPNLDRTGPDNQGPMTGRGLGDCSSNRSCDNFEQDSFEQGNGRRRRCRGGQQQAGRTGSGQMRRGRNAQ